MLPLTCLWDRPPACLQSLRLCAPRGIPYMCASGEQKLNSRLRSSHKSSRTIQTKWLEIEIAIMQSPHNRRKKIISDRHLPSIWGFVWPSLNIPKINGLLILCRGVAWTSYTADRKIRNIDHITNREGTRYRALVRQVIRYEELNAII